MSLVTFGELTFDLQRKPIKNLHISVLPPDGRVQYQPPSHCQTQRSGWL